MLRADTTAKKNISVESCNFALNEEKVRSARQKVITLIFCKDAANPLETLIGAIGLRFEIQDIFIFNL